MRRSHTVIAVVAVGAVLAAAGVVLYPRDAGDGPDDTAGRYFGAWQRGDHAAMRKAVADPPGDLTTRLARFQDDLRAAGIRLAAGKIEERGDKATAAYRAQVTLKGGGQWAYDGSLNLVKRDGDWRVAWSPRTMHPALGDGQRMRLTRTFPRRAGILAADGSRLDTPQASGSVQQLAGQVAAATDADVKRLGEPYRKGDPVGSDGFQRQYERRLAGKPQATIQITDASGKPVRPVGKVGGTEGEPLRTTIRPRVQTAAGKALAGVDKPASLVAVRPSTGEILAVANKPGGYNRALLGQYAPGSTFKVITAAALVAGGLSPGQNVDCPAKIELGGRSFRNYKKEDFGTISFRKAFAHSCNTTFAKLASDRLGVAGLSRVTDTFGFGTPIIAGLPAARAAFPKPKDTAELATASFGQGRVLTSPLNMATVAAAAANGTWRSPRLVTASVAAQAADAKGKKAASPRRLEPAVQRALRSLMPAVVSEGTAKDVSFPSGVAGKTGTAEYGSGKEPPTHAWFVGYRGDLAFSVIVEGGGTGAEAAAPIAARFLRK